MKRIFVFLAIASASSSALAADYFDKKYELQLMPNVGYSNFDGFVVGLEASLLIPLSERWQWKLGGGYEAGKHSDWRAFRTGAVYNFADDWSRAYYLGAGVGLDAEVFGYVDFGKRFSLNKAGTITWSPHVTVESNSIHRGHIVISPVSFGWSF